MKNKHLSRILPAVVIMIFGVWKIYTRTSTKFRYILLWTSKHWPPFQEFGEGQKAFIAHNCLVQNCYVTDDINFFGNDPSALKGFDAILFNGKQLDSIINNLPSKRYQHQKYVYVSTEAADNYPICNSTFKNFFNWTATYRLDSDIVFPYLLIVDSKNKIVGPKLNMQWNKDLKLVDKKIENELQIKSKAVAWFVSHCKSRSGRELFATQLIEVLDKFNLTVDVYGKCGTLKCSREKESYCMSMLKEDYFFYLAMENAINDDYVTEKVTYGLENNVVPIVFGGANYNRFLPPDSYLDARTLTPEKLANSIYYYIKSPDSYRQFFKWKSHYKVNSLANRLYPCRLCEALNDAKFKIETVYDDIRKWWHPNYTTRCKEKKLSVISDKDARILMESLKNEYERRISNIHTNSS